MSQINFRREFEFFLRRLEANGIKRHEEHCDVCGGDGYCPHCERTCDACEGNGKIVYPNFYDFVRIYKAEKEIYEAWWRGGALHVQKDFSGRSSVSAFKEWLHFADEAGDRDQKIHQVILSLPIKAVL